jgi:hypothetical protein
MRAFSVYTLFFPNARVVMSNFDKAFLGVRANARGIPILLQLYATTSVLFLVIGIYFDISGSVSLGHYLSVAAIVFTLGVLGIFLNRKNVIIILMSIELIPLSARSRLFSATLWGRSTH